MRVSLVELHLVLQKYRQRSIRVSQGKVQGQIRKVVDIFASQVLGSLISIGQFQERAFWDRFSQGFNSYLWKDQSSLRNCKPQLHHFSINVHTDNVLAVLALQLQRGRAHRPKLFPEIIQASGIDDAVFSKRRRHFTKDYISILIPLVASEGQDWLIHEFTVLLEIFQYLAVDVCRPEVESPVACPAFGGDLIDSVEAHPSCLLLIIPNEIIEIVYGLTFELHPLVCMLRSQELKNPKNTLLIFAVIRPIHHSLVQ